MILTRIGLAGAWLVLISGGLRLVIAFYVASLDDLAQAAMLKAQYLGSRQIGEIIDRTTIVMVCAIALGILAEISRSIHRKG
ncbi:hypothetical protein ASF29_21855 [Rhizobium sp. Leaf262]|nr:hypothetical protein ASF29_21855 [Rhizobium sp. Leaf262]